MLHLLRPQIIVPRRKQDCAPILDRTHPIIAQKWPVIACLFDQTNDGASARINNYAKPDYFGTVESSATNPTFLNNQKGRAWRVDAGLSGSSDLNYGLDFGSNLITGTTPRTVLLVHMRRESETNHAILLLGANTTGQRWTLRYTTGSVLRIEISGSGYDTSLSPTLNAVSTTAVVYTGGNLSTHRFYVNGTFGQATGTNTVNTGTTYCRLSSDPLSFPTQSSSDEYLMFLLIPRALCDSEIRQWAANPWAIWRHKNNMPWALPAAAAATTNRGFRGVSNGKLVAGSRLVGQGGGLVA